MSSDEQSTSTTTATISNWGRFRSELSPCQAWFTASWPSSRVLDIPATFCPRSLGDRIWKALNTTFIVFCLIYNWIDTTTASFYLAYVTNWALVVTVFYTILSCFNTFFPLPQPGPDNRLGWRLKATWAAFVIASHGSVVVTIYYWGIVWSPGDAVTFASVNPHGVTMVFCLVDGLVVNRIPLRGLHWIGLIVPFDMAYLIWSIIHAYADIGNPNVDIEGLAKEDEAIYTSLNWSKDPGTAAMYGAAVVLVLGPIIFMTQWYCGTNGCCCCSNNRLRLLPTDNEKDVENQASSTGMTSATAY